MADLTFETAVSHQHNFQHIAGLDEAGRGALAGPVTAAAVILPLDNPIALEQLAPVNDSKQLTAKKREVFFELIVINALAFGVASVPASVIDQIGIIPATKQAMRESLTQLTIQADYLLIDGRIRLATLPTPQQSIIRGDSKSLSIAAASILAKVTRDRKMIALAEQYPNYGFARHKGYGTQFHTEAIEQWGATAVHRYTFAPIRQTLL